MGRSREKGPYVDEKLYRKVMRRREAQEAHPHLGQSLHDRA